MSACAHDGTVINGRCLQCLQQIYPRFPVERACGCVTCGEHQERAAPQVDVEELVAHIDRLEFILTNERLAYPRYFLKHVSERRADLFRSSPSGAGDPPRK